MLDGMCAVVIFAIKSDFRAGDSIFYVTPLCDFYLKVGVRKKVDVFFL